MINRPRGKFHDGIPDGYMLESCLKEQAAKLERLERLRNYYDGNHDILRRERGAGLPNVRMMHAFPRYISTMATGYLIGSPVEYEADGQTDALETVLREYRRGAIDSVDAQLARDASIYGKGVELIYANAAAQPCSTALDPRDAFVVYGDDVAGEPLMGVCCLPRQDAGGRMIGMNVQVYTDEYVLGYNVDNMARPKFAEPLEITRHYFGRVPMIEYWNDEREKGDFEDVISLIDAYNQLESDRLNDKQQFVDGLLVLYGCTLEADERGRSPGRQLREDKVISLPDSDARAEWLCKQMNEADTEVLKNALRTDIHKMSMVPDLTDEQFAGNSSGVAMRYKLLGLEQMTRIKERWFREALRERLRAYAYFLACRSAPKLDVDGVRMIFTRSLPVNELEEAQTISKLKGILADEELQKRAMRMAGMQ